MNQRGFFSYLLVIIMIIGIGVTVYLTQFTQIFKPKAAGGLNFFKIADSSSNGYPYAYAPSIIYDGGKYHVFYCSMPTNSPDSLDSIRYTTSTDGINWTTPVVKLITLRSKDGMTAGCDPSVVYFQGYYYLYYSSVWRSKPEYSVGPTVVSVARSSAIDGNYLIYTDRGTWEQSPTDPKNLVIPLNPYFDQPNFYGAGEQSVIAKDGKLIMFHTDNLSGGVHDPYHIYKRESTSPVDWSAPPVVTGISAHSPDIKYDPLADQFVMTAISPGHDPGSSLVFNYSKDGINWQTSPALIEANNFPDFAHNVGISSNKEGAFIPGPQLVGFGAPYDLNPQDTWGNWDLYGVFVEINPVPIGYFDGVDCNANKVSGWSCDPNNFNEKIQTHLYFDGPAGVSTDGYPIVADLPREPQVGSLCGGNSVHGFSMPIPEKFKDGQPHPVYAYGINYPAGVNVHLPGSPVTFQCNQPSPSVITPPVIGSPNTRLSPSPSTLKIGDTDGDGDVDIFDFNKVITDFGKKNDANTRADLDNDNDVDIFDFNLVVTHFGK